jgi:methionyl-tRNA formyltransferase
MKIVFFGSPPAALPSLREILKAGHRVELVITQQDRPAGRGRKLRASAVKSFAMANQIPTYESPHIRKDSEALDRIRRVGPDINVVVAYGQIIPSSIIYLPKYKSINVHFSLLPKYRGASPVQWAILQGETKTGVTIFELNERMDEGNILSQEEVVIHPRETAGELETRLAQKGASLLVKTLEEIDRIHASPQDHSQATYAPLLKKEDGKVDWQKNALYIERLVRAFNPWPSAFTFLGEKRIKILKGKRLLPRLTLTDIPGRIKDSTKEGIEVICGEGSLFLIEELQPEGKKPMKAYAFSLGVKLNSRDAFN